MYTRSRNAIDEKKMFKTSWLSQDNSIHLLFLIILISQERDGLGTAVAMTLEVIAQTSGSAHLLCKCSSRSWYKLDKKYSAVRVSQVFQQRSQELRLLTQLPFRHGYWYPERREVAGSQLTLYVWAGTEALACYQQARLPQDMLLSSSLAEFPWSCGNGWTNNRGIGKLTLENYVAHTALAFICYVYMQSSFPSTLGLSVTYRNFKDKKWPPNIYRNCLRKIFFFLT